MAGLHRHRTVVVPLLDPDQAQALDLACRLAADGSRLLLLAPLFVEWELPLDAHFKAEEAALESTGDFRRPFSRDVCAIIQDAPCPVLIATGPRQSGVRAVA